MASALDVGGATAGAGAFGGALTGFAEGRGAFAPDGCPFPARGATGDVVAKERAGAPEGCAVGSEEAGWSGGVADAADAAMPGSTRRSGAERALADGRPVKSTIATLTAAETASIPPATHRQRASPRFCSDSCEANVSILRPASTCGPGPPTRSKKKGNPHSCAASFTFSATPPGPALVPTFSPPAPAVPSVMASIVRESTTGGAAP